MPERLPGLMARGRVTEELADLVGDLAPERAFLVTGLREIAAMHPLPWAASTSLVLASPRLRLREILSLGPRDLWGERHVLLLPFLNALLPASRLRRGFERSGAEGVVYVSRATRRRLTAEGLPPGQVLTPQVEPFDPPAAETPPGEPVVAYLGPPLATRGACLAVEAFERAAAHGLRARLLMLLRPDVPEGLMDRLLRRVEASPAKGRIEVETAMLDAAALRARLAGVRVFLFPFRAPVSEAPLVVLEAGLSGRPVVVLDAPGVGEYARALGGIVARDAGELPAALLCACHRPRPPLEDPGRWTSWPNAAAGLLHDAERPLRPWRFIGLCGVDGSGKTTLLRAIERRLAAEGVASRHVWSRFRNYLSKPLLALTRLTGHNRKEVAGGARVGYHDFEGRPFIAWPFLALQVVDNLIDLALRYRGRRPILGDRCVLDTVVDLAVDTGLDDLLIDRLAPRLVRLLPEPRLICLVERHPARIGEARPDAVADRGFARRQALFRRLADRLDLPVIDNNGLLEESVEQVWRLATPAVNRGEAE